MRCWVSKGKRVELISEGFFGKYSKIKILVLKFWKRGHILRPFSGKAHTKIKMLSNW